MSHAHIITRTIHIPVADGTEMPAFLALPPQKGAAPAVVVFQEIFGVNNHIRDVTKRLAQAGYVAIAPELFHRTAPGFHGTYDDYAPGRAEAQKMTQEGLLADLAAVHAKLTADPHVKPDALGAIGFCLGGRVAFLMNAHHGLRAAVMFYGSGFNGAVLADLASRQHAPLLMMWGGHDKHIPPETVREVEDSLRERKKPYTNVVFGDAGHGFFCDERPDFRPAAARQAWALTTAFLHDHLSGGL